MRIICTTLLAWLVSTHVLAAQDSAISDAEDTMEWVGNFLNDYGRGFVHAESEDGAYADFSMKTSLINNGCSVTVEVTTNIKGGL